MRGPGLYIKSPIDKSRGVALGSPKDDTVGAHRRRDLHGGCKIQPFRRLRAVAACGIGFAGGPDPDVGHDRGAAAGLVPHKLGLSAQRSQPFR